MRQLSLSVLRAVSRSRPGARWSNVVLVVVLAATALVLATSARSYPVPPVALDEATTSGDPREGVAVAWESGRVAQTPDEQAVLAVVQGLFDAMAARDADAAAAVLLPEGVMFRVAETNGTVDIRSSSNAEFVEAIRNGEGRWLERMWDAQVRVHGRLATVWTPYDFHLDGELSHCGVDAFDLVKAPDGWKIAGGAYTVERQGCDSPLGPPR